MLLYGDLVWGQRLQNHLEETPWKCTVTRKSKVTDTTEANLIEVTERNTNVSESIRSGPSVFRRGAIPW